MSLEDLPKPAILYGQAPSAPPLTESLRRSSRAVALAQAASQLVTLAALAILLRLLGPEPYGLMFMVVAVLNLLRILGSSGLDLATIQQQELSQEQVSSLFWINQALGLGLTVAVAASAPLLSWFMEAPIGWLTVAMAGTLWVSALGLQHLALLQRRLRLGTVAYVRLVSLLLGAIGGVVAAWVGWGVWALVLQQYLELIALAAMAWAIEPWRPCPGWPAEGVGRLVRFGGHCTFSSLMFGVINSVDKLLIGRALGADVLGLYNQAFNLMQKPVSVVVTPLTTSLMMPGLSRAAGDPQQFRRLMLVFFRFLGLLMLPAGIGLAVVAPETMRVLGGNEWATAGPILAVLALSILAQGFFISLGSVLAAAGRADRLSLSATLSALVMSGSYFVGLYAGKGLAWPVMGVAWAYTLTLAVVVLPVYLGYVLRTLEVSYLDWLAQLRVSLPAAVGMGAAVLGCRWLLITYCSWPDLPRLFVEVMVGIAVYMGLAWREIRWFLREGRKGDS